MSVGRAAELRVAFADFWPGFDPRDNWITDLLATRFDLVENSEPDVLVYSCYGADHRAFDGTRVLWSVENRPWGFSSCDWAFTSDYHPSPRHLRVPPWVAHLDTNESGPIADRRSAVEAASILAGKEGFASVVVSNGSGTTRNMIHERLDRYRPVASGGRHRNNVGGPVPDKLAFIRRYKFNIACENSSYPGYTSEKLLQALQADTIPIYWGDPLVERDFNLARIVSFHEFASMSDFVDRVIELDCDDDAYREVLAQPWFHGGRVPACARTEAVLDRFEEIRSGTSRRVATDTGLAAGLRRGMDRARASHRYRTRAT